MTYPQVGGKAGETLPHEPSNRDAREPVTKKLEGDEGERARDDQGNAITDQAQNENVAERTREEQEKKK